MFGGKVSIELLDKVLWGEGNFFHVGDRVVRQTVNVLLDFAPGETFEAIEGAEWFDGLKRHASGISRPAAITQFATLKTTGCE